MARRRTQDQGTWDPFEPDPKKPEFIGNLWASFCDVHGISAACSELSWDFLGFSWEFYGFTVSFLAFTWIS